MNAAAWKRLGNSERVIVLASASHLAQSDVRASMYLIGRLNMIMKKSQRVYVPENTHDTGIMIGAALYECLKHVRELAQEFSCDVHIRSHVVYAANKHVVLHLASVDKTNNSM